MSAIIDISDGRAAYQVAMENLKSTWNNASLLHRLYSDRYFIYGEEGRGLALSHGLVYVSSEGAEDIRAVNGPIEIGPDLTLRNANFRSIDGQLPDDAIGDIVSFTGQVRSAMRSLGATTSA